MTKYINIDLLRVARESRMITQKELCKKLTNITQASYSRMEKGLQLISEEALENIANTLDYPISFFYKQPQKTPLNLFDYRKRLSLTQKATAKLEANFERIRISIDELLDIVNIPEYTLINLYNCVDLGYSPSDIAQKARHCMGVPRGSINNLVETLEENGIIVLFIEGDDKFDGINILTDKEQPIILVNSNMPNDRKRFTIAHELGHLVMHAWKKSIDLTSKEREAQANEFASEFLVPLLEIKNDLLNLKYEDLNTLKLYWKVSKASLIYKLNGVSESKAKSFRFILNRSGQRINEFPQISIDQPQILKQIIDSYKNELGYTKEELSYVTGMNEKDMYNLLYPKSNLVLSMYPKS